MELNFLLMIFRNEMGWLDIACSALYRQSTSYFIDMITTLEHYSRGSAHTTVSHLPSKSVSLRATGRRRH